MAEVAALDTHFGRGRYPNEASIGWQKLSRVGDEASEQLVHAVA